ncbi:MAG: hypothetical protein J0I12_07805 [Candidatus Eremiobacteraeota bacterium]|nr:hypothetical protein [Candidatus Eremiobacteraeota bacterium]
MRKAILIVLSVLLCLLPAWSDPANQIDLVEWLFQRPLNCVEIQVLSDKDGWQNWAKVAQGLDHPTPTERATLLQQFRADTQPFATTACNLDQVAHRQIAPGLEFQSSEAFAEWLLFGMAIAVGSDSNQVLPGSHFRDAVQTTLAVEWPKMSTHYKEVLVGFPSYWANMRKQWPTMSFEDKNVTVIAWQNNLANVVQRDDVLRLANASLQDLQDAMRNNPAPQTLEVACDRLIFCAQRLRRPDIQDPQLSDQLIAFVNKARNQQASEVESAQLMQKLDIPKVWYSPIWTDTMDFPGYWAGGPWGWGWGSGYPYFW